MVREITGTAQLGVRPAADRAADNPGRTRDRLRLTEALGRKLDAQDPAVVREIAARFVAELFFKPLLAEMRAFPFGRELATGGQTESAFGQILDEHVADTVAASDPGITADVIRHFEARARRQAGAHQAEWPTQMRLRQARSEGDA
jgi:Rod binding domain-containing protein